MLLFIRNLSRWLVHKTHRFLDSKIEESGVFLNKEDEALIEDIVKGRQNGITMDEQEFADLHERLKHLTIGEDGMPISVEEIKEINEGIIGEGCDLYNETVLKTCLDGFYSKFNSEMLPQIDSIAAKYIGTPNKLVKKLEKKYEASLYEYCPTKSDSITSSRLSAWETDKQIYLSATFVIILLTVILFLTVPLQSNPKLASQLDVIFLIALGVGALNMSHSTTMINAVIFCFGGSYVAWILARKWTGEFQEAISKRPVKRKPRRDWYNY